RCFSSDWTLLLFPNLKHENECRGIERLRKINLSGYYTINPKKKFPRFLIVKNRCYFYTYNHSIPNAMLSPPASSLTLSKSAIWRLPCPFCAASQKSGKMFMLLSLRLQKKAGGWAGNFRKAAGLMDRADQANYELYNSII
ncbi:MAG: hypothetical protein KGY60_07885, partial [Bacteroidales bacterium]|nr:hypothetical protein [Bacteroidales bacterium]